MWAALWRLHTWLLENFFFCPLIESGFFCLFDLQYICSMFLNLYLLFMFIALLIAFIFIVLFIVILFIAFIYCVSYCIYIYCFIYCIYCVALNVKWVIMSLSKSIVISAVQSVRVAFSSQLLWVFVICSFNRQGLQLVDTFWCRYFSCLMWL